jgi:glycosyltransferase involved in cell wall biosynthesis
MRIGFLTNTCEPFYHGGYEARIFDFARQLANREHEVTVLTSCDGMQTIQGVRFIPVVPARDYFNDRGVRNLHADARFAAAVFRMSASACGPLDVLDVNATPFVHVPAARHLARKLDATMILTCCEALLASIDGYVRERQTPGILAPAASWLFKSVYRRAMSQTSHRVAISPGTAKGLAHEGYPAEFTSECGIDLELYRPHPRAHSGDRPLRFAFAGRLVPNKRVETALLALHPLHREGRKFDFDVIGAGSELPRLQAVTQGLGLRQAVHFHGFVSDEKKRSLLADADVFLMTSPREGFSLATMEAMASGCAIVAASPPPPAPPSAVTDYLRHGENGLLFDGSPEDLVAKILPLANDPAELQRLSNAASNTARAYDIRAKAAELEAYYQKQLQSA